MTGAVFPGTFDPMTLGHMDVLRRAAQIFDHIIVAVAESADKRPLLSLAERVDLARELTKNLPNVQVEGFNGLLCDFVRTKGVRVIVRGLRPTGDIGMEYQMACANRVMVPETETVFLVSSLQYQAVKGSLVREIAKMGGDVSAFIAPAASKALSKKLN